MKQNSFIVLENWQVRCRIGVTSEEQKKKQLITLCVRIKIDLSKAMKSDKLPDTLDYRKLKLNIEKRVKSGCFNLLEKLVAVVIEECFAFRDVQSVYVKAIKNGALGNNCEVGMEVEKERN